MPPQTIKQLYRELAWLVAGAEAFPSGSAEAALGAELFAKTYRSALKELGSDFDGARFARALAAQKRLAGCRARRAKDAENERQKIADENERKRLLEEERMQEEDLARSIYDHAEEYINKKYQRRFGDGAERDFRRAADKAASDIIKMPEPTRKGQVNLAILAFERMINEMAAAASEIQGYDASILGEQTFAAARLKLCPLYPFC